MIYRMKIVKSSTTINFNPFNGTTFPNDYNETRKRTLNNHVYTNQNYAKRMWKLKLKMISASDASQINTWKASNVTVNFYPDLINNSSTSYVVTIQNKDNPLKEMMEPRFNYVFEGDLDLQEIL